MDTHAIEAKEVISASKRLGKPEAKRLVQSATRVIAAKGPKVQTVKGGEASGDVVDALLGPTGNLRAPILRVGKTVLVGFDEDSLSETLL